MSIALEARVAELEAKAVGMEGQIQFLRDVLRKTNARIDELERTAQRKPGPKPKDATNG